MSINTIIIRELVSDGRTITMPVTPELINFKSGGTRFITYEILDLGEVKIPNGKNLRTVKWDSVFPGKDHVLPFEIKTFTRRTPEEYQSIMSVWKVYETPLKLLITGTPINMNVYLKDYNTTYEGAFGDIGYSVEFIERENIVVTSSSLSTESESGQQRQSTETTTYTVKKGDCLWNIAKKHLGKGSRWKEIYDLNKDAIEQTAKKYGKKSSNNGHWIYPGTVLHIPK